MAETNQFGMPLLASAQAQKHVTVNEALSILDAVAQFRIASADIATPPIGIADGTAYLIPAGALGEWATQAGKIAVAVNDGWRYVVPQAGWQVFNAQTGTTQLFDGVAWLDSTLAARQSGAATGIGIAEVDHIVEAGAASVSPPVIPAGALVIGVTARVTTEILGDATSWRLGVADSDNRYGENYGMALGSYARGMTSTPVAYYQDTPLIISGDGGTLSSGAIKLDVHYLTIVPARA